MFLKKIKFVDNIPDAFKISLGKDLQIVSGKLKETQNAEPSSLRFEGPVYENNDRNLYNKLQTFSYRTNSLENDPSVNTAKRYHNASMIAPVHRNIVAINDDSKAVSSGYVTAKFNFLSEQYEQFTTSLSETQLPCIYLESDPQQTKTIMDLKFFTRVIPKARHFYDFNYILKPRYNSPSNTAQFQNLLYGQNFSFSLGNAQKEQYPFYNNIRFNYNTKNDFKNVLKEYNFFEQFIEDYITVAKNRINFLVETSEQQQSNVEEMFLRTYDMTSWLQKSDLSMNTNNKVIFEPNLKIKNKYDYFLDKVSFVGKLRKMCKSKMPNIQDILNNKPVESEVLFFRIDKFVEGNSTAIQSFWVPADDNYIDYVDTQVKYGLKYTYTVHAYVLVFGCNYRYIGSRTKGSRTFVDTRITPSFQLVEIPNIYSDFCRIIQPPQPSPTVRFVNEKNAKNYLKIYLNLTLNSNDQPLNIIHDEDINQEVLKEEYDKLKERPRFVYNNERALYEIYRTDFVPKSFTQLRDYKLTEIRNAFPSTGASHKDYIMPFKKYYYVFRSVNFHGLVSNPTPIYEIELTKDADETFLSSKTVGFLQPETSQPTRKFIKLLQAVPATQHTVFENNLNGMVDEEGNLLTTLRGTAIKKINLGVAEHPIWGKKFKFRITSTTTGKKLDINIKVNLIKKKTLENSK